MCARDSLVGYIFLNLTIVHHLSVCVSACPHLISGTWPIRLKFSGGEMGVTLG